MTREERLRALDMGDYFRVAADNRDLNYDKYFVEGRVETQSDESYTSSNTRLLDVDGVVEKLLIIVGTRPEIIRLSAVIKKCRRYFDTILAHTGQNYDYNLNGVLFKDLALDPPEVCLDAVVENLGFHDYNCLQMNAFAVVSDSGTLPEESSFFTSVGQPFPAVCIRTSTERPEALDKGCFVLAGIDETGLLQAVKTAVEMVKNGDNGVPVPDYLDENVSDTHNIINLSETENLVTLMWANEIFDPARPDTFYEPV